MNVIKRLEDIADIHPIEFVIGTIAAASTIMGLAHYFLFNMGDRKEEQKTPIPAENRESKYVQNYQNYEMLRYSARC